MVKKVNIVSKALLKLKLMQKQMAEESQVLDELKEKEDADECELKGLRSELSAKAGAVSALNEGLKKQRSEKEKLAAGLEKTSAELKAALDRNEALKEDDKGRRLRLDELNALNQRLLRSLREKEETYKSGIETAKAETAVKKALAASLQEELKKRIEESGNLSRELIAKSGEFKTALDKERTAFRLNCEKMGYGSAEAEKLLLCEVEALKDSLRRLNIQLAKLTFELEKAKEENAAIKELRDSSLVKITEQDIFSKSAVSALKENQEELGILKDSMETISGELSKSKTDSKRKLELMRLELDEKNKQLTRLTRELDATRSEKESLKAELTAQEKK